MKRLLAVLSLTLLVSLVVLVAGVGAAGAQGQGKGSGGNDTASGWVRFGIFDEETFSAKSSEVGTNATGHWRETRADVPNYLIAGQVRCLRVSGDLFEARGVITDVRGTTTFARGFVLQGSDSGKFSTTPDTYRSFLTASTRTEASCLAPVAGFVVTEGEITVQDAT